VERTKLPNRYVPPEWPDRFTWRPRSGTRWYASTTGHSNSDSDSDNNHLNSSGIAGSLLRLPTSAVLNTADSHGLSLISRADDDRDCLGHSDHHTKPHPPTPCGGTAPTCTFSVPVPLHSQVLTPPACSQLHLLPPVVHPPPSQEATLSRPNQWLLRPTRGEQTADIRARRAGG
jgi:hypothetical protein